MLRFPFEPGRGWLGVILLAVALAGAACRPLAYPSLGGGTDAGAAAATGAAAAAGTNGLGGSGVGGARAVGPFAEISFRVGASIVGGSTPSDRMAVGDVDGDGKPDLVTTDYVGVTVLLNQGMGRFAAPVTYQGALYPQRVAIGDLDGDGRPDLAIADQGQDFTGLGGTVNVLFNLSGSASGAQGGGMFGALAAYAAGGWPRSVAIGDLDGDGRADLAVANGTSNDVSVLLNRGGGLFAPAVNYASPGSGDHLVIADLDGDGDLDLVADHVLLNDGDGTFVSSSSIPGGAAVGDLNGDGHLDVVALDDSPRLLVALSRADGSFADPVSYGVGVGPDSVAVSDLDGDGSPDLAVANSSTGDVSLLWNQGDGGFDIGASYFVGPFPGSIAAVDLDGDGRLDLVLANGSLGPDGQTVVVLQNLGSRRFAAGNDYRAGADIAGIVASDLDGDGRSDLVVADSYAGTVNLLVNHGDATFPTVATYTAGTRPSAVVTGDFDHDGWPDVAVANQGDPSTGDPGGVAVLLNAGQGTLGSATAYRAGTGPAAVAAGDLNGDGSVDLAVANRLSNDVSVFLNSGHGTFAPARTLAIGMQPAAIAIADLNRDGKPDLIAVAGGTIDRGPPTPIVLASANVLIGQGNGSFAPFVVYDTQSVESSLAIADIDGDGTDDLAVGAGTALFLNAGDGTFGAPAVLAGGGGPIAVADLNGDGRPDLVSGGPTYGWIRVLPNVSPGSGPGSFGPAQTYGVTSYAAGIAISDLDGDGKPDLAVATGARVSIFINTSH